MENLAYYAFTGIIDSQSAARICAAANQAVNEGRSGIYYSLSSPGGMTADGLFIYNHLRAMPIPVTIHATGNVASIALTVVAGATRRICSRHVLFMMHPTTVPGSAEGMTWDRLRTLMDSALAEDNRTEGILRERYTIPDEQLAARRFREVHFTPKDALEYGIVHEVAEFSLPSGAAIMQI